MNTSNQNTKIESTIAITFFALLGNFVVLIATFIIPAFRDLLRPFFLVVMITFSLLGMALTLLTLKQKIKGSLRKLLLLAGVSAAGFMICSILHNLFYALAEISSEIKILSYLMQIFEVIFFLIAIFICPVGFLVGVIGSVLLLIRNK